MVQANGLKVTVRISVSNAESDSTAEFGYGVAALCEGVRETGSLYASAKRMGMSYSKAWHIVRDTEQALGIQLLHRDGARGSTLTDDCVRLIEACAQIRSRLDEVAEGLFAELVLDGAGGPAR